MEDIKIWEEILKMQLDGVMYHIALFEHFMMKGIYGMAAMHKYQAKEEFKTYLHILCDYIDEYHTLVTVYDNEFPTLELKGETKEDNMVYGMTIYENWEQNVIGKLKDFRMEIKENGHHLDHLICDVKEELKCIRLILNDLDDNKADELDIWLQKKYGEE